MAKPSLAQRQRERLVQLRLLHSYEAALAKALKPLIAAIGDDCARAYTASGRAPKRISPGIRTKIAKVLKASLYASGLRMGNRAVASWKAKNRFQEILTTWVDTRVGATITSIDSTMIAMVRNVIAGGVESGDHSNAIAQAIRERMDDVSRGQSLRIARTEIHTASSVAQHEAASEAAIELQKTWCSAQDDRTREDHAAADGQVQAMDEAFDIGGESMMHPGEGSAEQTINCRCCVLYTPVG